MTYELHPTIEKEWSLAGDQPTAERGTCGQREGRLLSAMDAESGKLFYRQKQSVGRTDLIDLYREMTEACRAKACEEEGENVRLWVVQDNAPFLDCVQFWSVCAPFSHRRAAGTGTAGVAAGTSGL